VPNYLYIYNSTLLGFTEILNAKQPLQFEAAGGGMGW
jgi:hypothetical protein